MGGVRGMWGGVRLGGMEDVGGSGGVGMQVGLWGVRLMWGGAGGCGGGYGGDVGGSDGVGGAKKKTPPRASNPLKAKRDFQPPPPHSAVTPHKSHNPLGDPITPPRPPRTLRPPP